MKKVFIAKNYQNKGTRFEVLGMTARAILLKITQKGTGRNAFQVLDACDDYPETEEDKQKANIFRTVSQKVAEKEYSDRNQLKIS